MGADRTTNRVHEAGVIVMAGMSSLGMCGVGDYAERLGRQLERDGFEVVTVWERADTRSLGSSARAAQAMCRAALGADPASTILWNYSSFAHGFRGLPLHGVLFGVLARAKGCDVITIAHEFIAEKASGGTRRRIVRLSQQAALYLVVAGSSRLVVTTEQRLQWFENNRVRLGRPVDYAPVFSTVEVATVGRPRPRTRRLAVGVMAYTSEGVDPTSVVRGVAGLGDRAELMLLGAPGPTDPTAQRWGRLCRSAGVPVTFSGVVPAEELSRSLSGVDVVVHASLEGPTGRRTTLAAALAHERPVIAFRGARAWSELIEAGAVQVVDPTPTALTAALTTFMESPEVGVNLGRRGLHFYEQRMSVGVLSDQIGTLAKGLRGGSRMRRLALVVNRPGIQERRAAALTAHLTAQFEVRVVVAPAPGEVYAATRWADLLYIIDPGKGAFPTAVLGRLLRRPVIVEVGDPQAALYRAQGRGLPAIVAGKLIDRLVARKATGVVVRGRRLAESLDVRVPWKEIPDGVDLDAFRQLPSENLRCSLGLPADALVVGLVGSLELAGTPPMSYGWDIAEALGILTGRSIWGLVVGDGPGRAWLAGRAKALGVADRLVLPGRVPHHEVPRYISAMDVCVSTQSNDAIGQARTTAKLPEYLACDRYILATEVGGARDVLPPEMLLPYRGARDPGHPERLAHRLESLLPRRADLRKSGGTRSIADSQYAYPVLADRLVDFLAELSVA